MTETKLAAGRLKMRRRRRTLHGRAYELTKNAAARAAGKGIEFEIDPLWVKDRLAAGKCEVTGLPLRLDDGPGRGFGPSLDRSDNSLGYTKDNTKLVCWMYNAAKGVSTHEDVLRMAEALCSRQ